MGQYLPEQALFYWLAVFMACEGESEKMQRKNEIVMGCENKIEKRKCQKEVENTKERKKWCEIQRQNNPEGTFAESSAEHMLSSEAQHSVLIPQFKKEKI